MSPRVTELQVRQRELEKDTVDFPTKGSINRWFLPNVLISPLSFILRICWAEMTPPILHQNREQMPACNLPASKPPLDTHFCLTLLSSWCTQGEGSVRSDYFKNLILSHPALSPEIFYTFWKEWFGGGKWQHHGARTQPFLPPHPAVQWVTYKKWCPGCICLPFCLWVGCRLLYFFESNQEYVFFLNPYSQEWMPKN